MHQLFFVEGVQIPLLPSQAHENQSPEKLAKLFDVNLPISILIKPCELSPGVRNAYSHDNCVAVLMHKHTTLFFWFAKLNLIATHKPVCCNIYNSVILPLGVFSKVSKLEDALLLLRLLNVVGFEQVLLEHHLKCRTLPSLSS